MGKQLIGRDVISIKPYVYEEPEFNIEFEKFMGNETIRLKEKLYNNFENKIFVGSIEQIKNEILEGADITKGLLLENLDLDGEWWEYFKKRVKSIALRIQRKTRALDSFEYMGLQRDFIRCKNYQTQRQIRNLINAKLYEITKKNIFNNKLEELNSNEKCSSFFFRKVGQQKRTQFLEKIQTEQGDIIKEKCNIEGKKIQWG